MSEPMSGSLLSGNAIAMSGYEASNFIWSMQGSVGTITLNRPDKKNPLTFDSYAELRDLFRKLQHGHDTKSIVITGAGANFCSGGDVHEIIAPLTRLNMPGLV